MFLRTRTAALGAALVASLALTACGTSTDGEAAPDGTTDPSGDGPQVAAPAALADRGTITYCATLDNPPRAYVDESADQTGFEVALGEEMAALMGLEVTWLQLTFDGLISALQADQCHAIVQELFIKPERLEIIDMIPFSNSGQQLVLAEGSDLEVTKLEDLSGLKLGVPNGTTVHTLAEEANEALRAAGETPIDLLVLPTTTDTFQQLSSGVIDAVGTTTTAAAYYTSTAEGQFQLAGEPFGLIETGIGVRKGNDEVLGALEEAFGVLVDSGRYDELVEEWNMQGSEL